MLLCSCSVPFTRGFRENHGLSDREVGQVQFFTSDDILLRRSQTLQDREIGDAELEIHTKVAVEEVDIPSGTPCVAVRVEGEFIEVAFSPKHPERTLWFSTRDAQAPGRYGLTHVTDVRVEDGKRRPVYSHGYTVRYGGKDYRVIEPETWKVYLMFDGEVSSDRDVDSRRPPGWELKRDRRPSATVSAAGKPAADAPAKPAEPAVTAPAQP